MGSRRKLGGTNSIFRIKVTRGIQTGTLVNIADNSGAKVGKVVSVTGYRGRLNRYPKAAVGDMVVITVKKGKPELRKKIMKAVVVRQKQTVRRIDGTRVRFEDNSVVLVTDDGDPKGTQINGPIAREAADLWPRVSNVASQIV